MKFTKIQQTLPEIRKVLSKIHNSNDQNLPQTAPNVPNKSHQVLSEIHWSQKSPSNQNCPKIPNTTMSIFQSNTKRIYIWNQFVVHQFVKTDNY